MAVGQTQVDNMSQYLAQFIASNFGLGLGLTIAFVIQIAWYAFLVWLAAKIIKRVWKS